MALTVEQVNKSLDNIELFLAMAQIPATSIDDTLRAGFAKLQEAKENTLIELVVKFLNFTPAFGCANDDECHCEQAGMTQTEAWQLDAHKEFLTLVRANGCYQFC